MENIFRSLSFTITQLVYPLISYLYNIFELIAKNQFFTNSDIEALSQNIYIIISACMLFTLGLKLLSAIVNPDALDGESGGKGTKRTAKSIFFSILIALFLIILIPIGFNWLYTIQSNDKETGILDRHLVEKIVLGTDTTEDHVPGQILASYAFASFCHPRETVSVESIANDGGNLYNLAITENIEYIRDMDGVINSRTDGEYDIEYHAILSPAVGLFLTYEMILICIDIALRSIKLGLLQLITSVVLCGYVVAGSDLLKRWAKEVMSTYLIVYIKIAAMSFMVYGLSLLEGFLDRLDFADDSAGFWSRGLIRVFVIIGLLQLVRQLPDLINKIFGTNIQRRGGIRGRLGEMAAVGDIAQRAWDQLRTHPLQTGQRLISAPVSAIGGYFANRQAVMNKGDQVRRQVLENGGTEAQARRARRATIEAGMAGSFGAMFRAGRAGWQNGNLQGIGAQARRYEDTHPTDLLAERYNQSLGEFARNIRHPIQNSDRIRTALGMRTRYEEQLENDKMIDIVDQVRNPDTGAMENRSRRMSFEQLQREQTQYNEARALRDNIVNDATKALERGDSTIQIDAGGSGLGTGTYSQLVERLNTYRANADEYGLNADDLATMADDLARIRESAIHQIATQALSGVDSFSGDVGLTVLDSSGSAIGGVSITGTINGGQFHDMVFQQRELNTKISDMDSRTLDGIDSVTDWDTLDTFNVAAGNHQRELDHSVTTYNDRVSNRVNSAHDRAMKASNDAIHNQNNNGGNNHGGNNG